MPDRAKMFMGFCYSVGDGLVVTVPLVRSGALIAMSHGTFSLKLISDAYGADFMPVVASFFLVISSLVVGRFFALGHAGTCLGSSILTANLFMHDDPWTGAAMMFTVIGGAVGAAYPYLERRLGQSRNRLVKLTLGSPKKMAGLLFAVTSIPTIFTSIHEEMWALLGSGIFWFAGNFTSMLLPHDEQEAAELGLERPVSP
jgi:hypothetical protein